MSLVKKLVLLVGLLISFASAPAWAISTCAITGQVLGPDNQPFANGSILFSTNAPQVVGGVTVPIMSVVATTDVSGNISAISLDQGLVISIALCKNGSCGASYPAVVPILSTTTFGNLGTGVTFSPVNANMNGGRITNLGCPVGVNDALAEGCAIGGAVPASGSFTTLAATGATIAGDTTTKTLGTITLYADQFAGADWAAKTNTAQAACPANKNCIIDMRNLDTSTNAAAGVLNNNVSNVTYLLGAKTYSVANGQRAFQIQPTTSAGITHPAIIGPEGGGAIVTCGTGITNGCVNFDGSNGFLGPFAITDSPMAVGASSFTAIPADVVSTALAPGDRLIIGDRQAGPSDGGIDLRRQIWATVVTANTSTGVVTLDKKIPLALNSIAAGTWLKIPNVLSYPTVKNIKVTTTSGFAALQLETVEYADVEHTDLSDTATNFKAYNQFQCWRCFTANNLWAAHAGNIHAAELGSSAYSEFQFNTVTCPEGPVNSASVVCEYGCTGSHMSALNDTCATTNGLQILDSDQFVLENSNVIAGTAPYLITGSTGSRFMHNFGAGGSQGINIGNNFPSSGGVWTNAHTYTALQCVTRVTDNNDLFCTSAGGTSGGGEPSWNTCNGTAGAYVYGTVGTVLSSSDVAASSTDNSYTSAGAITFTGLAKGQLLTVAGFVNGGNNGVKHVLSVVNANKITVSEALTTEASGAAVTFTPTCQTVDNTVVWTYFGKYNLSSGNIIADNTLRNTTNALAPGQDAAALVPAAPNMVVDLDIDSTVTNTLFTGATVQTQTQMCTNGWIFTHRDKTTNLMDDECPRSARNGSQVRGTTSGVISLLPQAAAGTYNWNWPITAGTLGQAVISGGGGATAMSYQSFEGGIQTSGLLANLTSTASATLLQQCAKMNSAGHLVSLKCTTDLNGSCTTAPTFGTRDTTSSTNGSGTVACSNAAGTVTQSTPGLSFSAGDEVCITRTINGGTCATSQFGVDAHWTQP